MSDLREQVAKVINNIDYRLGYYNVVEIPEVMSVADEIIALVREDDAFDYDRDRQLDRLVVRTDERTKALDEAVAAGDQLELPGEWTGLSRQYYIQAINDYQKAIEALKK